ncbi:MAG: ATP-dependent DNA helicase RecG [Endomicrobium sp.]|jgi:ATP-dependent DNA helicase RecG|nr:ATP-dependent DNA helicase RecG [Endomicrobium sp.]
MLKLTSEVQYLNRIGTKRASAFAKLGVRTIEDALTFFPVDYHDRTKIVSIRDIGGQLQGCIFGRVGKSYEKKFMQGLYILDIEIFDDTSMVYIRFFRKKTAYSNIDIFISIKKDFEIGTFAYAYGKMESGSRFMIVNDYEIVKKEKDEPSLFNKIIPIYPATEALNQKFIRKTIKTLLEFCYEEYPDVSKLIPSFKNIPRLDYLAAIKTIHWPNTLEDAENARRSFALQEFFVLETALSLSRNNVKKCIKTQKYVVRKTLLSAFKNNLKFEFTRDQKNAINDIFTDMQKIYPMNRMLMGDVGSGKTVVALSAILLAVENGYQTMIIVPTEILAEQHYFTISNMLLGLCVEIGLVTSSTFKKEKERKRILAGLEDGNIKIAIGTHSLIEDRIKFKNLSLIVLDEQHRFGVMQKFEALNKAQSPDVLMMTATPIPRALAMTVYGEMDKTIIAQLPPGRIQVQTYCSSEQVAYTNAIEELKKGNQAYVVYPIIEESDKLALKSAKEESDKLSQTWFKDFKVGLLHGKMNSLKKNEVMQKFKNKEFDVLITTTVIEVGIDVPDATVMIIQHAERFGLSVLHQLRGRIGRSFKQSYAHLVVRGPNAEIYNKRLSIMVSTNSGFEIAQEDLKMRGPGELIGVIQHGFPKFKAGDLIKDSDIIEFTKMIAAKVVDDDPNLSKNENAVLKKLIYKHFSNKMKLVSVG